MVAAPDVFVFLTVGRLGLIVLNTELIRLDKRSASASWIIFVNYASPYNTKVLYINMSVPTHSPGGATFDAAIAKLQQPLVLFLNVHTSATSRDNVMLKPMPFTLKIYATNARNV